MDYFKHYSSASDGETMNLLFDKFKHKGVAFYWMLTELCCENWDGHGEPKFTFHRRNVATKLKSSVNCVRTWLNHCDTLGALSFTESGTSFEIHLPKLLEIKTSRNVIKNNKKQLPVYKNRIEENRIDNIPGGEVTPLKVSHTLLDAIQNEFNSTLGGHGKIKPCMFLSSDEMRGFVEIKKEIPLFEKIETWKEVFENVKKSKFLQGQNDKNFVLTLGWLLLNPSKLTKTYHGAYEDTDGQDSAQPKTYDDYLKKQEEKRKQMGLA